MQRFTLLKEIYSGVLCELKFSTDTIEESHAYLTSMDIGPVAVTKEIITS